MTVQAAAVISRGPNVHGRLYPRAPAPGPATARNRRHHLSPGPLRVVRQPPRIRYDPTGIIGFMEYVAAQGRSPRTECLHAERRPAGPWLVKRMGLEHPEEPVFYLQRRRWVDQRPVLLECNVLVADWGPKLLDADPNNSLTTLLRERFGRVQLRSELSMHPETMNDIQADLPQVSGGSSSFYLESLSFGGRGQPVEFDQEFWRPDALVVVL